MKIEADKWLEEIQAETNDRARKSVYVSEAVWAQFQESVGEGNVSRMIEKLMREFNKALALTRQQKNE